MTFTLLVSDRVCLWQFNGSELKYMFCGNGAIEWDTKTLKVAWGLLTGLLASYMTSQTIPALLRV